MTIWTPGWLQAGTFTAQQDRVTGSRAADFDEGVANRRALKVTQRAAGANLSVDVAAGKCIVTGDDQNDQGNYAVYSDAVVNLTGFSAPGSNSRYDAVVMQINDPNAGGAAGSNAVITRIAGTAAGSPVIPAIPNSALLLAIVGPILTSTTSITNAMIHDVYTGTGPTGVTGARLCQGFRDTPGASKETYNTVAPNGWLMEFGQQVSRTTYADLFEHLGTAHGAGDGSSTFNVPDSRGRVAVALDNMGGADAGRLGVANTLGGSGGLPDAVAVNHDHTDVTIALKEVLQTTQFGWVASGSSNGPVAHIMGFADLVDPTGNGNVGSRNLVVDVPALTGETGVGKNLQPYILLNRMIRT